MAGTQLQRVGAQQIVTASSLPSFRTPNGTYGVSSGGALGFKRVDVGTIGVQVRAGRAIDALGPGMHWTLPLFDRIVPMDAHVQVSSFKVNVRSVRGLPVSFEVGVVHQLAAHRAAEFLHNVGPDYSKDAQKVLVPIVSELIRWAASNIVDEYLIGSTVSEWVGPYAVGQLEQYGIQFLGIHFNKISLSPVAEQMIARTAAAQMEVTALHAELGVVGLRRQLAVEIAVTEATVYSIHARARADAEAYREGLMHSEAVLTDRYLELERIRHDSVKWDALARIAEALGGRAEDIARMLLERGHDVDGFITKTLTPNP